MNKLRCRGLGGLGERICLPPGGDREAKHAFADRQRGDNPYGSNPKGVILIVGLIMGMTIAGSACSGTQSREKVIKEKGIPVVKIGSLKKNPSLYLGKMVTVKGEYRGWRAEGSPPVTRSDWGVRDETGTIYITGRLPNLDPYQDIGRKIAVTGTLHLKADIPYIKAVKIEIGKEE